CRPGRLPRPMRHRGGPGMTHKKQNPGRQPGVSESPAEGDYHSNHASTPATRQLAHTVPKLSRRALFEYEQLPPWNSNLTRVEPAPDYLPGVVKTSGCLF